MRLYPRSMIHFARCVVELIEISIAPERAHNRWRSTNRLQ